MHQAIDNSGTTQVLDELTPQEVRKIFTSDLPTPMPPWPPPFDMAEGCPLTLTGQPKCGAGFSIHKLGTSWDAQCFNGHTICDWTPEHLLGQWRMFEHPLLRPRGSMDMDAPPSPGSLLENMTPDQLWDALLEIAEGDVQSAGYYYDITREA